MSARWAAGWLGNQHAARVNRVFDAGGGNSDTPSRIFAGEIHHALRDELSAALYDNSGGVPVILEWSGKT